MVGMGIRVCHEAEAALNSLSSLQEELLYAGIILILAQEPNQTTAKLSPKADVEESPLAQKRVSGAPSTRFLLSRKELK